MLYYVDFHAVKAQGRGGGLNSCVDLTENGM